MRYAILSDVHANVDALRAVLTDAADMHAERIVCLGDVLGYGPEPVETLELVYRRVHVCLAGNHDDAVSGRYSARDFTQLAAAAVRRHRAMLAQKAIIWLRGLPYTCEFPSSDGGTTDGAFACAHGEFYDPKHFDYVLEPADAIPSWRERTEQLLFVGHTHKPGIFVLGASGAPHRLEPMDFLLEPGKRYLVNVGSVGYPRGSVCRSFYCLYDDQARAVLFRSLPFDLEGYRAKMNGQGMDEIPWIEARAQERKRAEIRGKEQFGRPAKNTGIAKRQERLFPDAQGHAESSSPQLPNSGEATPPPLQQARFARPFVFGAILLALGGSWCTVWLTQALREKREERVSVQSVEVASVAVPSARTDGFAETLPLSSGWDVSFMFPGSQRVQVDRHEPTKETVFRLESGTNGLVRFSKRLSLFAQPPKVYYTARKLTSLPPDFMVRVVFFNAAGRQVGEDVQTVVRSRSNRAVRVPSAAEAAELWIECDCKGTCDFAIPEFRTEPIRAQAQRKR